MVQRLENTFIGSHDGGNMFLFSLIGVNFLVLIVCFPYPEQCDPALLPEPNHVMLNHLYALSIKVNHCCSQLICFLTRPDTSAEMGSITFPVEFDME